MSWGLVDLEIHMKFVDKIGLRSTFEVFIDGADRVRNLWNTYIVCGNMHSFSMESIRL